ncbi:hypothetical protein Zm00014a_017608 [Zea mays]|uniref:Uncharacterized protein n=1 Tax=Zea mays TaxID=4577 RepID=A0A3L6D7K2_MAIZE|nr:hypothetical protein Zm00014a_017608 [Zea mays]
MDHTISKRATESQCNNADGQPPPLLDSPLPTPRRSCTSVDALRIRCRRDASPLRTHVPFSWESSPGVPKNSGCGRDTHKKAQAMPPPRPPPGRLRQPYLARNLYYGNTSEASSDDDDDNRSFSDTLDRISSPERTGSFDRVTSKRFEDIFVGRATSFAKDRTQQPGVEATDLAASGGHPRQPRRDSTRRSHDEDRRWVPRLLNDSVPMQLMQRIKMDADAEEMTPRACGLMMFFPWSAKPVVYGFRNPAAQHATTTTTTHAGTDVPSPSHSRRVTTTTLRDVIKQDSQAVSSDMPQPRGEKKRGRNDLPSRRWGVSSLLDTSKKYCTDARKALSKLSIGLGADGGTPRVNRSGKLHDGFSSTPATPAKLTQLKANRN